MYKNAIKSKLNLQNRRYKGTGALLHELHLQYMTVFVIHDDTVTNQGPKNLKQEQKF
jgi:hypothetical protein